MTLRIKELCKEKGTTLSKIAEEIGTTQTSLSRVIGEGGNPTLSLLQRTADALSVSIIELFESKSKTELTALVEYRNDFYKAETLEELKEIVSKIESK